jgi:hypothetical protein
VLVLVGVGGVVALAIAGYYFTFKFDRSHGADAAALLEAPPAGTSASLGDAESSLRDA